MPLQRRLPKRGFKNPFRVEYEVVNVGSLDKFENGAVVDIGALIKMGLISKNATAVKVLAKGEISKKLTIRANSISEGALKKVASAGGIFETAGARA
mgnify:CR=1 FL=1